MTQEEFRKRLDEAAAEVETWPLWKQNIIRDSLNPRSPRREPVNNFRDEQTEQNQTSPSTSDPT